MTITTAVTSVAKGKNKAAPVLTMPAPTPPAAAVKGRKPIILKGGKPYAEARDEAKANIANAKAHVQAATAAYKEVLKVAANIQKDGAKAVQEAQKALDAELKNNVKDAATAAKRLESANTALEKAVAAAAAIEDQKAALTAKPN